MSKLVENQNKTKELLILKNKFNKYVGMFINTTIKLLKTLNNWI